MLEGVQSLVERGAAEKGGVGLGGTLADAELLVRKELVDNAVKAVGHKGWQASRQHRVAKLNKVAVRRRRGAGAGCLCDIS